MSLVGGGLLHFLLAKYSRTIIRISPLTDVPFSCAICRNFSIISGEKKTFVLSLLAFGLGDKGTPPFSVMIISPFYHHIKRDLKTSLKFQGRFGRIDLSNLLGLVIKAIGFGLRGAARLSYSFLSASIPNHRSSRQVLPDCLLYSIIASFSRGVTRIWIPKVLGSSLGGLPVLGDT